MSRPSRMYCIYWHSSLRREVHVKISRSDGVRRRRFENASRKPMPLPHVKPKPFPAPASPMHANCGIAVELWTARGGSRSPGIPIVDVLGLLHFAAAECKRRLRVCGEATFFTTSQTRTATCCPCVRDWPAHFRLSKTSAFVDYGRVVLKLECGLGAARACDVNAYFFCYDCP